MQSSDEFKRTSNQAIKQSSNQATCPGHPKNESTASSGKQCEYVRWSFLCILSLLPFWLVYLRVSFLKFGLVPRDCQTCPSFSTQQHIAQMFCQHIIVLMVLVLGNGSKNCGWDVPCPFLIFHSIGSELAAEKQDFEPQHAAGINRNPVAWILPFCCGIIFN